MHPEKPKSTDDELDEEDDEDDELALLPRVAGTRSSSPSSARRWPAEAEALAEPPLEEAEEKAHDDELAYETDEEEEEEEDEEDADAVVDAPLL